MCQTLCSISLIPQKNHKDIYNFIKTEFLCHMKHFLLHISSCIEYIYIFFSSLIFQSFSFSESLQSNLINLNLSQNVNNTIIYVFRFFLKNHINSKIKPELLHLLFALAIFSPNPLNSQFPPVVVYLEINLTWEVESDDWRGKSNEQKMLNEARGGQTPDHVKPYRSS